RRRHSYIGQVSPVEFERRYFLMNGTVDECLNEHWFLSLRQAKSLIENWRVEYNTDRPHSALGYLTPAQFVQAHQKEGLLPLGSMSVPY
ncbi:integrase core domain-containing protein, partial [Bordetella holmesii]|uniref:integrase core domain-containing protein n=1 Tax=Bordetella holmesii TaxID=35814 RepID=UPI0012691B41